MYTQEEVDEVIRKHSLWLRGNDEGERANFNMDISGLNLSGADLSYCIISGPKNIVRTNFNNTNLSNSCLYGKEFRGCNMIWTNLSCAYMEKSTFYYCNMTVANFTGAIFGETRISSSDCSRCIFRYTDMKDTELYRTKLSNANFYGANILHTKIDFCDTENIDLTYAVIPRNYAFLNLIAYRDRAIKRSNDEKIECKRRRIGDYIGMLSDEELESVHKYVESVLFSRK